MRSILFLCLIGCAMAFSPMAIRSAPSLRRSPAAMHCSMRPLNHAAASAAVAAVLLSSSPVIVPNAMAEVAPNPYAKEQPTEAAKPASRNDSGGIPTVVYVAIPLLASVFLALPFFKRNVERFIEKGQGKR